MVSAVSVFSGKYVACEACCEAVVSVCSCKFLQWPVCAVVSVYSGKKLFTLMSAKTLPPCHGKI